MSFTLPQSDHLAFFLDFDGTLVDIEEHPDDVEVDPKLNKLLLDLRAASNDSVALISGRALSNLLDFFDGTWPFAAGSHGAEWTNNTHKTSTVSFDQATFCSIKEQFVNFANKHELLYEDKGFALAVHTRLNPQLEPILDSFIDDIALPEEFVIIKGKSVRELKLAGVHKGLAVSRFMQLPPFADKRPVFIGDDRTDEDGFHAVNRLHGISIKVGTGPTVAHHRLANPESVRQCLTEFIFSQQSNHR